MLEEISSQPFSIRLNADS